MLVLGDSTARGLANGLHALGDPKLLVWDRSVLSCSLGGESKCPDWRQTWPHAVQEVRPDIVLVDMIPIATLDGVDPSNVIYLSASEAQRRTTVLTEAMRSIESVGAKVVWMRSPHLQMPAALFYCKGRRGGTMCDPAWVDRWNESVDAATTATGTIPFDASGWPTARPDPAGDRLDGIHYTGQALIDFSTWMAPQLKLVAQRSRNAERAPE